MTLGKKLSGYRKLSGMTQQQLGDKLNLSPQAISKWENDLAEPDLTTLKTLAELYQVTVDKLLDLNDETFFIETEADEVKESVVEENNTIGYCKSCGIIVTEETLGQKLPVILCKDCKEISDRIEKKNAEARAEAARIAEENAKAKKAGIKHRTKVKMIRTFVLAGIIAAAFLAAIIMSMVKFEFTPTLLGIAVIGTYVVFSYVTCMCLDTFVNDVFFDWSSKAIEWPGLIFTFDLDGCLWLIGMKLLFWFLGALFGLVTGLVGIIIGMVCAPFIFPYVMAKIYADYKDSTESEYIDY